MGALLDLRLLANVEDDRVVPAVRGDGTFSAVVLQPRQEVRQPASCGTRGQCRRGCCYYPLDRGSRIRPWLVAVGVIAAVVLALVIAWWMFVPAPDWLAHHDVGSVTGSAHETAPDNARGRLLTLAAGLLAAGALVRYTKAIEQLGSDKLVVRIGGIYALEPIARDSDRDHTTSF